MQLNERQRQVVEHRDGPLLVLAGPGSGKTRCATQRVNRLIGVHGVEPTRILSVTFTNKAAGELRERLSKSIGSGAAKELWAGTFHSLCVRLMRAFPDNADRAGRKREFVIYDEKDSLAVVRMARDELELDRKDWPESDLRDRISRVKTDGLLPDDVREQTESYDERALTEIKVWERYEEILRANQAFDFDDLIAVTVRAAEAENDQGRWLRSRFHHVLIDEYQDTNALQFRFAKALSASTKNLCVVGDLAQAIYSFRGADIRNIRMFQEDFPGAVVVKLDVNYRSSQRIVACSNALQPHSEMRTDHGEGSLVRVRGYSDQEREASGVVQEVLAQIRNGTPLAEIAVLYRVHALSRAVEQGLQEAGIRYQVVGGLRFYERRVAKDVLSYLRILVHPDSDLDAERVINTPPRALGDKAVAKLREEARAGGQTLGAALPAMLPGLAKKLPTKAFFGLKHFVSVIEQARAKLGAREPLADVASFVIDESGYRMHLSAQIAKARGARKPKEMDQAEQELLMLDQLVSAVGAYAARHDAATLQGYLAEVALMSDQDELKSGQAVSLLTGHACKGLEFDVVWVVGFERGFFPFMRATTEAEREEEARIAFVACSRARKHLVLSYCEERMMHGKLISTGPSSLLKRLPLEILDWPTAKAALATC